MQEKENKNLLTYLLREDEEVFCRAEEEINDL